MAKRENYPSSKDKLSATEQQLRAAIQQLQASEQQLKAANQQLEASNQKLRASEQEIRGMEENWRESFNSLEDVMILIDRDFNVEKINDNGLRLIGKSEEQVVGSKCYEVFHGLSCPCKECPLKRSLKSKKVESLDRFEENFGRHFSIKSSPIFDEKGKIVRFVDLMRDITERKRMEEDLRKHREHLEELVEERTAELRMEVTERKQAEESLRAANQQLRADEQQLKAANQQLQASEQQVRAANQQLRASEQQLKAANQQLQAEITERKKVEGKIKASLKEKEVLLKEVHHRVKNNMQVISSILNLQSKYVEDERALEIFKNGQSRIRSMALVHEKLYESEDLANIDFAEYVHSITHYLFGLHGISPRIRLNVDIKDILLDVNTAVPCALIINELISNSLKYAFPEGIEGEIYIQLFSDKDGELTLIVKDNGIGFPKDLDFRKTESLGMQLIIMLVEQLEGTIELDKTKGTRFTIKFETPKFGG